MYTDMFEIIDNEGTIHSGSEDEMRCIWEDVTIDGKYDEHIGEHTGDLKLIQIQDVWNG